jgi:glycosyltransferase involved in cell wall biosynthesis
MKPVQATIIIPTYNASKSLGRTLASLEALGTTALAQIIVCDDGSTDDTEEVVNSFSWQLPLLYRRQEDRGFRAASARNLGIKEATGDVVIFIDSDVVIPVRWLDAHLKYHQEGTNDRLVFGFRRRVIVAPPCNTELAAVSKYEPDHREALLFPHGERLSNPEALWYFAFSCNMSVGGGSRGLLFDEDFIGWGNEDLDYAYRVMKGGAELVCAPDATLWHVDDEPIRDVFRCDPAVADFGSFLTNAVRMLLKHSADPALRALLEADLIGYRVEGDLCVPDPANTDIGAIIEWATKRIRCMDARIVQVIDERRQLNLCDH